MQAMAALQAAFGVALARQPPGRCILLRTFLIQELNVGIMVKELRQQGQKFCQNSHQLSTESW